MYVHSFVAETCSGEKAYKMKVIAVFCALLLAGTNASPQKNTQLQAAIREAAQRGLVEDLVSAAIEDLSQNIRDLGLDPWSLEESNLEYALPVPAVFSGRVWADNVLFTGASNIVINRVNYALLTSRITFDISLPEVALTIGEAGLEVVLLGNNINASVSGSVRLIQPRITGTIRISLGIFSGISVRSIAMGFDIGTIESNLNVNLLSRDASVAVNSILGEFVPNQFNSVKNEINDLIDIIAWQLVDKLL